MTEQANFQWTKDDAIAALVKLSRDPGMSAALRKDIQKMILLIIGAIDLFEDSEGETHWNPDAFAALFPNKADNIRFVNELRRARLNVPPVQTL